jgi:ferritin-like metal-binding protein YciE
MPHSLRDVYLEELQDLYSAEQQIIEVLPQLASAATSPDLERAFAEHLEQTTVHRDRLELILKSLNAQPGGHHCEGMAGLIKEGRQRLRQDSPSDVKDAVLISAAQRVEHYEIAGYGTARTYARLLGDWEGERLLQQTLDEEGATDHLLTDLATSGINQEAINAEGAAAGAGGGRQWSRLRYLDVDDLDDSSLDYRRLTVRGRTGDDLGTLDGFVVETASGRPLYYVIDSGGWFMGRRYLVPVGRANLEATRHALVVDVDRDTIKSYPEFSTNAFMAMSDDEIRRYERRVLHTINPNAAASTTYWESYHRLPDYSQPDWLRPMARQRRERRIESIPSPDREWRGTDRRTTDRSISSADRSPAATVRTPDARLEEHVVAQQDQWTGDPRDNTRDDAGQPMSAARAPERIDHDDDLAR